MKVHVESDARSAAVAAARHIARRARQAIAQRQRFALALSGGNSPLPMFDVLADSDVPWSFVHLYQVDERFVPGDSLRRNFAAIRGRLVDRIDIPETQVHPMPVERGDPHDAAREYAETLERTLPGGRLDLVHLGLGADGHTASLLPGDPAVEEAAVVLVSQPYQGTRRLSLSSAVLSAARERTWLVTGVDKRDALARLLDGDLDIPAGRLERRGSIVFTDLPCSSRDGAIILESDGDLAS